MKKVLIFVGAVMMFGLASLSFAQMKIGVIDVNKVLANVEQVKDMQNSLKKEFDPQGQEVIKLQNNFRNEVDKYRQSTANKKGAELQKEQQKLIDDNKKLREVQTNFQRDLVAAQNRALSPILQQIESVVDKIAKEQKYDLIITKISTVYSNPKFEITDQVITDMAKLRPVSASKAKAKANGNGTVKS